MSSLSSTAGRHSGRDDEKTAFSIAILMLVALAILLAGAIIFNLMKPNFTVKVGDNLVDKLGYERAINYAADVGLPIYLGSHNAPRGIKLDRRFALNFEKATDRVEIFVPVYAGDKVDMRFGNHFTPISAKPIGAR